MKSIIFKLISDNLHQNTQHHSIISVMLLALDCQCLRDCGCYCKDAIGIPRKFWKKWKMIKKDNMESGEISETKNKGTSIKRMISMEQTILVNRANMMQILWKPWNPNRTQENRKIMINLGQVLMFTS